MGYVWHRHGFSMVHHQDPHDLCIWLAHCLIGWVLKPGLTRHIEIMLAEYVAFSLIGVTTGSRLILNTWRWGCIQVSLNLPQQSLKVLKIPSASMKAQNAHEDILIICAACHWLDEVDVRVLGDISGISHTYPWCPRYPRDLRQTIFVSDILEIIQKKTLNNGYL